MLSRTWTSPHFIKAPSKLLEQHKLLMYTRHSDTCTSCFRCVFYSCIINHERLVLKFQNSWCLGVKVYIEVFIMMYVLILQQDPLEPRVCSNYSLCICHDWCWSEPVALSSFSSAAGEILYSSYILWVLTPQPHFSPRSDELRKEARQLKKELQAIKQRKEESSKPAVDEVKDGEQILFLFTIIL